MSPCSCCTHAASEGCSSTCSCCKDQRSHRRSVISPAISTKTAITEDHK
ncbi:hypothetical protein BofuT4_P161700.1 [Botrytis cinerea T4]|uniref:Metallothionein n=1 Tax=Botryotinia fuckeliana (strain T4) TaxID=999810 RepID=G2YTX1_BOTF4|nr:hypothetical protein BofuT4_P161700.1 [Botrytis cinerea T4]